MKRKILYGFLVLNSSVSLFLVFWFLFFMGSNREKTTDSSYRMAYQENYRLFSPEVPNYLSFAGEAVPLDTFYVREGLERELLLNTFWQSNTMLLMKRAYRWFPVIEPILKKNNLPDDFKYLALIESHFLNAASSAGAAGFWQFVKETGQRYGLEISEEVDERYNLEKATEAACKYLQRSKDMLGNWTLAAAGYNMGEYGVKKQLEFQKSSSYYDLYLNDETARYLYRILSAKILFNNAVKYGYYLRFKDLYQPIEYKVVKIDSSITNMVDFAKSYNVSYRLLKELNPWIRKPKLTNKNRIEYLIKIPDPESIQYSKMLRKNKNAEFLFGDTIINSENR